MNRGVAEADLGDLSRAADDYDVALNLLNAEHLRSHRELDPSRALIQTNRGNTRARIGDLAGALAYYDAALAIYDADNLRGRRDLDPNRAMTQMAMQNITTATSFWRFKI